MKNALALIVLIAGTGCATTNSNQNYQPTVNSTRNVSSTRTRRSGGIFSRRGGSGRTRGGSRGSGGSGRSGNGGGGHRRH